MAGTKYEMFFQGTLAGSGPEALFTVEDPDQPTNTELSYLILEAECVNIDEADDAVVTVWLVPDGETIGDEWIWRPASRVEAGGASRVYKGSKTLQAGYTCYAEASGSGLLNFLIGGARVDERTSS